MRFWSMSFWPALRWGMRKTEAEMCSRAWVVANT
jgi:hypothetical protein